MLISWFSGDESWHNIKRSLIRPVAVTTSWNQDEVHGGSQRYCCQQQACSTNPSCWNSVIKRIDRVLKRKSSTWQSISVEFEILPTFLTLIKTREQCFKNQIVLSLWTPWITRRTQAPLEVGLKQGLRCSWIGRTVIVCGKRVKSMLAVECCWSCNQYIACLYFWLTQRRCFPGAESVTRLVQYHTKDNWGAYKRHSDSEK